ncbi:hypothetical protein XELAEV_18047006mg [Xenopus laevis]|uniref:Transmembrane protein n=1 Tax=Xenopus laevis TaxID=8355 RepID=A0A974H1E4_XENLA|nr:hypothetical protein XELAEV_18047006mg [Xenopus laevis]
MVGDPCKIWWFLITGELLLFGHIDKQEFDLNLLVEVVNSRGGNGTLLMFLLTERGFCFYFNGASEVDFVLVFSIFLSLLVLFLSNDIKAVVDIVRNTSQSLHEKLFKSSLNFVFLCPLYRECNMYKRQLSILGCMQ